MKGAVPKGQALFGVRSVLAGAGLPTVCEEALCPNRTDCWARGTLAFQILGSTCTRRCSFCAEATGRPGPVDPDEPAKIVEAVRQLKLRHVVITSPARDDLEDQGSGALAACVRALRAGAPTVGGLGMLVNQGALAFELWFEEDLKKVKYDPRVLRKIMGDAARAALSLKERTIP
jgi:lipoate synthase